MSAVLTLQGVHTYYAKSHILHDVCLGAEAGEIVTLLGRNGAGKTTTLRSIMGLTPAREGRITLFGEDITRRTPFQIAAMGVGYVPEGRRVFGNLTVEENLLVPVSGPSGRWTLARVYDLFPRLRERRASKARTLSGGEQEMLAIARALLVNPRLLILDEPSQGLAPLIVRDVFRTVKEMKGEGITVLLVEQNVRAAVEIAERAFVMDDGRIVWSGPAAEFAADEERVRALAGASTHHMH
ncbi:MAG TPA: ABC transporter ATP-binding protein [Acidisphaera sp.]|nr:ABC transporter ATP-binding protein [Acidisphaera sp.]